MTNASVLSHRLNENLRLREAYLSAPDQIDEGAFGARMAALLSQGDGRAISFQTLRNPALVVTSLRCDAGLSELSAPVPAEDAFIVSVHLRDLPFHELKLHNVTVHTGYHPKGGVNVLDLQQNPRFFFPSPFHCLHFYVRRATLERLADDHGARRIETLSWPHGAVDETVSHLGLALLPALERPECAGKLFLDHVVLALNTHFAYAYGGMRSAPRASRGGLAPWQERRCKELMNARLADQLSLNELAKQCRLSISHFARAFRQTTGESPHRWLLKRRIEAAKELLISSERGISEVALDCGFTDQSHLTRVFSVMVGAPPGVWRRGRGNLSVGGLRQRPQRCGSPAMTS
jgi:AraC family transcriptional regulator